MNERSNEHTLSSYRSLKPILNGVADEYTGKIYYVEIDIEADPEIAEAAGVAGTPTLQVRGTESGVRVFVCVGAA